MHWSSRQDRLPIPDGTYVVFRVYPGEEVHRKQVGSFIVQANAIIVVEDLRGHLYGLAGRDGAKSSIRRLSALLRHAYFEVEPAFDVEVGAA